LHKERVVPLAVEVLAEEPQAVAVQQRRAGIQLLRRRAV
jgi:hypothetical protein